MRPTVTIIDYGVGNLFSVARAFEVCGANVVFASNAKEIAVATHLVLPGVGAFECGMLGLKDRDLIRAIIDHATAEKPLIGICLGMQMLATVSEEFGEHQGLNLIPGRVLALPARTVGGSQQKIPRIGWAGLYKNSGSNWDKTPLARVEEGNEVYLVHSYAVQRCDPSHVLAISSYGGHAVTTVIQSGAVIGCQFHPEKSGPVGLKILSSFLEIGNTIL